MKDQQHINYQRIEKAIHYLSDHFKEQPSLDEIAGALHVSPFHFQRMFSEWAGVSPKKFMQYLSLNHAKNLLQNRTAFLDAAFETGLSSGSRLHDLFVRIEGMTPREYLLGGAELTIHYDFSESPFGKVLVASTSRGICSMSFEDDENSALACLKKRFPHADYQQISDAFQREALQVFQHDQASPGTIRLHIPGTPFQIKVWESLLKIPMGSLVTYGDIARDIGHPKASRAVGAAVGSNPVAFLIPCHRVILSNGRISGYLWGETRKKALIGWEAAKTDNTP